jgi:hypothetical protein
VLLLLPLLLVGLFEICASWRWSSVRQHHGVRI